MINFFNVLSALFVLYPLFFFRDMVRWQQIGYLMGSSLWLLNLLLFHVAAFAIIAFVVLAVAGFEVVIKNFPLR